MQRALWCEQFATAWVALNALPTEKPAREEAEAAYKVAGLLRPQEAAWLLLQLQDVQRPIPPTSPGVSSANR